MTDADDIALAAYIETIPEMMENAAEREAAMRRPPWPANYVEQVEMRYLREVLSKLPVSTVHEEILDGIVTIAHTKFRARIRKLSMQ